MYLKNDSVEHIRNLTVKFDGDQRTKFMSKKSILNQSLLPSQTIELETMTLPKEFPFYPVVASIKYQDANNSKVSDMAIIPTNSVSFMQFVSLPKDTILQQFNSSTGNTLQSGRHNIRNGLIDPYSMPPKDISYYFKNIILLSRISRTQVKYGGIFEYIDNDVMLGISFDI